MFLDQHILLIPKQHSCPENFVLTLIPTPKSNIIHKLSLKSERYVNNTDVEVSNPGCKPNLDINCKRVSLV